jgi:sulfocyanin
MGCRRIGQVVAAAALVLVAAAGGVRLHAGWAAAGPKLPAWARVDAARKRVSFKVTAADGGGNGTLNFNGYANGQMTVTVPAGWRVRIDFVNSGAGALPHSLEVIRAVPASKIPPQGITPAIRNAETRNLIEGVPPQQTDSFEFTAQPAGQYLWLCGVPAHGIQGMWDRFVVSASAAVPSVSVR